MRSIRERIENGKLFPMRRTVLLGLAVSILLLAGLASLVVAHRTGSTQGAGGNDGPPETDHSILPCSSLKSLPATTFLQMQRCDAESKQTKGLGSEYREEENEGLMVTPGPGPLGAPSDPEEQRAILDVNITLDILPSTLALIPTPICLLNDGAQTPESASLEVGIASTWATIDARGVGCGWILNIRSSNFEDLDHNVIPAGQLSIQLREEDIHVLAGNSQPQSLATKRIPLSTEDQRIALALPDTGMGTFLLQPTLTLSIPEDTPPGIYSTTITLSIISGPK